MYESLASPEVGGEDARAYAMAASPVMGGEDFAAFPVEGGEAAYVCLFMRLRLPRVGEGRPKCVYA